MQKTFSVSLPTDDGFIGRECAAPTCGRYFKVLADSLPEQMYCPYCGSGSSASSMLTRDQMGYARDQALEHAKEYALGEVDKMFARLARNHRGGRGSGLKITHKPSRYRAKRITPQYRERKVDTELECPQCHLKFQVDGIFGYCPGCRVENQLIYDANILVIRQEIDSATDKPRALRYAYYDLVSVFETFCKRKAPELDTNFQDLFAARRALKTHFGVDILNGISEPDVLSLRRVFQKRHILLHEGGVIGERYVQKVPEDADKLGQQATLSMDEYDSAAHSLRIAVDNIAKSTPRPFS